MVFAGRTFTSHNNSQKSMKIYHPPLIPPIKEGKVPSPLVEEGLGVGYFRAKSQRDKGRLLRELCGGVGYIICPLFPVLKIATWITETKQVACRNNCGPNVTLQWLPQGIFPDIPDSVILLSLNQDSSYIAEASLTYHETNPL